MNWLTNLALAILLISIQYDAAHSSSHTLSKSPWADPSKARSFMNCLIAKIASSSVLPQREKEDLQSITNTLMSAINAANARGKSSGAQLQAINMAVASSLAELVVAEDVGNQASIVVKTQALSAALEQCFQSIMGTVNRKFINEINDLISMLATAAASELNMQQDQGDSYADSLSTSSSLQRTIQSTANNYQSSQTLQGSSQTAGGYRSIYPGSQIVNGAASQFPQPEIVDFGPQVIQATPEVMSRLTNALSSSTKMRNLLKRGISQQTASNLIQRIILSMANTLGVDGNNLSRIALPALSQLGPDSDTLDYARALSNILVTSGILNEGNIDSDGSRVLSVVMNGLSSATQVTDNNTQNNIRTNRGFLTKNSSSSSLSQTTASSISNIASTTSRHAVRQKTGTRASTISPKPHSSVAGDSNARLISRVANALAKSSKLKKVFRRSLPQETASDLITKTVRSLADTLDVDEDKLEKITLQTITQLNPNSDTLTYAQALSTILVNSGILNERNIRPLGSRVLSAVLKGLSSAAQNLEINADNTKVQNDKQSSNSFLTTSSSSTNFSQRTDSAGRNAASTAGSYVGGYPGGQNGGIFAGPVPKPVNSLAGDVPQDRLISAVVKALTSSPIMRNFLRRGVPQETASILIQRTLQFLANTLGVDVNDLSRIALQAFAPLGPDSDTLDYAQALSNLLITSGILNEGNIDSDGSQVLSAVLNGLMSAAQGMGMNVDNFQVQNDIQSTSSFMTSSSNGFSQTTDSTSSDAASTVGSYASGTNDGTFSDPVPKPVNSFAGEESQEKLISRVAKALASSPIIRNFLRRGVPEETASILIQRTLQSLVYTLGVDGNDLSRLALQVFGPLGQTSDTLDYAQALSNLLIMTGILNEGNIDSDGSRVLSAVFNGLLNAAQGIGMGANNFQSQNDMQSETNFVTSSSSNSFSQTADSTSSNAGSIDNSYAGEQNGAIFPDPVDSLAEGGSQDTLISKLSNAFASSPIMRNFLKRGVPENTASDLIQRTLQSLVDTLVVDGNNLSRIASQAFAPLGSDSDTLDYAQAFSNLLVTSGILNEGNIDYDGSRVMSAVLNGLLSAAQDMDMNVDNFKIQSSNSFLTSSSSNSFNQATDFTSTDAASTAGNYAGGYPSVPNGSGIFAGPVPNPVDSSTGGGSQNTLISRVTNALASSSIMRNYLRRGVPQETTSILMERTLQSLANTLGVDGNNLSRIAFQTFSPLGPGSNTPDYAQALSNVLVASGILNESNIDSDGSRVLTAVLNGLSSAIQGIGFNVDSSQLQIDIQTTTSFLTSSSTFSETASASSTSQTRRPDIYSGDYVDGDVSKTFLGQTSGSTSSSATQTDFNQFSGFISSDTSQGALNRISNNDLFGQVASTGISILSTLNSPNGLKSGLAEGRINQMISSILNAISPNGIDANVLARSLQASVSNLIISGMPLSDAKIESLLETIVSLLQILRNAQIRGLNAATAESVTSSAVRSFELGLA